MFQNFGFIPVLSTVVSPTPFGRYNSPKFTRFCWYFYLNLVFNATSKISFRFNYFFTDPQRPQESQYESPLFTTETQVAPSHYFRKIGETLSVTCEATGKPSPEIVWMKNGQKLTSGVNYIHTGKSSLDKVILDQSDAGFYSCM